MHTQTLGAFLPGLVLLAASASTLEAAPISTLFNTGAESVMGVDVNYKIVQYPNDSAVRDAYITDLTAFPAPRWFANGVSSWISPQFSYAGRLSDPQGVYMFRTSFDLTGLIPRTAQVSLRVAVDNRLDNILINGVSTTLHQNVMAVFSDVFTISTGFQEGVNTLDFLTTNSAAISGNPAGLRVEIIETSATAVPEPSSWGLLATGLIGLALAYRRTH